jgi:hypothetical protein
MKFAREVAVLDCSFQNHSQGILGVNPSNSFCFFDQFLQFLTYLEESISLPKKLWELEEVTVGS